MINFSINWKNVYQYIIGFWYSVYICNSLKKIFMKKLNVILVLFLVIVSNTVRAQNAANSFDSKDYALFGNKFNVSKFYTKNEMLKKYKALKKGDTISVQFQSNIKAVCKKKGCWMKMELAGDNDSFVKFKDYGFFVPLNADKNQAIVHGKAFIDVVSVDELKHYAKDGGKSIAEIAKIVKPEVTYAFLADGVYIKK